MNIKILGLLMFVFIIMLSGWFFFWPIVESCYAGFDFSLIWENTTKSMLFVFGGIVFWVSVLKGIIMVV